MRRRRRLRDRAPTLSGEFELWGYGATKRQRDTTGATLQEERSYPLHDRVGDNEGAMFTTWAVAPRRGRWGVPLWSPPVVIPWGPNTHFDRAPLRYAFRRVHWIPRLRQLPWRSWRHAIEDIPPDRFYPFPFYPSGRPSHASLMGYV